MHDIIKQNHHFVHKRYLESWCSCRMIGVRDLSNGKEYKKSPDKIAVNRNFYKLNKITEFDYMVLSNLLLKSTELHNIFKSLYEHQRLDNQELQKSQKLLENNSIEFSYSDFEKYYSNIEEILKSNNLLSLQDGIINYKVILYIWIQHFRTMNIKELYSKIIEELFIDKSNGVSYIEVYNKHFYILGLYFAFQASCHHQSRIILLENNTEVEFLTGLQPVIKFQHPDYFGNSLYYPISPNKALLLVTEIKNKSLIILTEMDVNYYNQLLSEFNKLLLYKPPVT